MKAAIIYKAKDIRIEDIEKPEPKSGEALIKIDSIGICGSDVHYYQHGRIGSRVITTPHILGHELSGTVAEVGKNNYGIKEGMAVGIEPAINCKVCELCITGKYNLCKNISYYGAPPVLGGMREYMSCPVENVLPIPSNITTEEGILLETMSIGIYSVDVANIKLGDSVAVFGTGNVGISILQFAQLSGASEIYMVDLLDYRLKIAEKMGAITINAKNENPVEKILDLTKGRGVDVGFEAAGDPETPQLTMNSIKHSGTFVFVGIVPTSIIQWNTEVSRRKELLMKSIYRSRHAYHRVINLVEKGKINLKPFITHRFPLEKVKDALETVGHYKDNVLKAIVKP